MSDGNHYHNRAIEALNYKIANCIDPNERLVLAAKRGVLFARNSYIAEAKSTVTQLRDKNTEYDARISAWIIFLEGIIQHFENLDNPKSQDKFTRAFLIGQVAMDRELAGLAASWLANCQFVAGKVAASINHLSKAFEWSTDDEHEARGRAYMVLAGIHDWIGNPVEAQSYLTSARDHASKAGDLALQNSIIFNSAAYAVARLTLNDCLGTATPQDVQLANLRVDSAHNLNAALGINTLQSMIPIMRAEILTSRGDWHSAIESFDLHIAPFSNDGQNRLTGKLFAQRAWCKVNAEDLEGAVLDRDRALEAAKDVSDLDDLAVLHLRLSRVASALGDDETAEFEITLAQAALDELHEQHRHARLILQKSDLHLPKK